MSQALEGTCTVSQNVPSGLTVSITSHLVYVNPLRPWQNGYRFADKRQFQIDSFNEN